MWLRWGSEVDTRPLVRRSIVVAKTDLAEAMAACELAKKAEARLRVLGRPAKAAYRLARGERKAQCFNAKQAGKILKYREKILAGYERDAAKSH